MDVLSTFTESKEAMAEVQRALFTLFESNDKYQIIRHSDLTFLELIPSRTEENVVSVHMFNYKDVTPRIVFDAPRTEVLACDESTITMWLDASRKIIERTNLAKLKRFAKEFPSTDHDLIACWITNHKHLVASGKRSEEDGLELVAKHVTKSYYSGENNLK
ncbi:hypothetical protein Acj9p064 [Acinetobacter phage Acj9]|uniref:Uncharacterized protein n=1 Tax=Acinetobacter phage Acj9 TaxID=760939 RepID=E5EPJ8_9CAUD|nr:hypothetical protein Acj9p064 [Acinetobacter phage Acj9]ADG59964.1 hypothetical protein Acj9p064 [Acinetobacter phage Acj9]